MCPLVRLGRPAGFGPRGSVADGLVLVVLYHVDQHLGRAQIRTRRFVSHLGDDRFARGDRAALPVDRHDHRLVQRLGPTAPTGLRCGRRDCRTATA
jgi:hypothetical protein